MIVATCSRSFLSHVLKLKGSSLISTNKDTDLTTFPITPDIMALIDRALEEDLGIGDPTTEILVPGDLKGEAVLRAKSNGILCGTSIALMVFERVDPTVESIMCLKDGAFLGPGQTIARIVGPIGSILRGERTALNFLQHLSGIATETGRFVEEIKGFNTRIIDTRKTIPGLRSLEKYAVRAGGGHNHRRNLGDGILIKDNHIAASRINGLTIGDAVNKALRRASHLHKVEVEVTSLEEAQTAVESGAQILLLDNMTVEEMKDVVKACGGRALLEASGGISIETVRAVAESGVDLISVGALTHSARALDINLTITIRT